MFTFLSINPTFVITAQCSNYKLSNGSIYQMEFLVSSHSQINSQQIMKLCPTPYPLYVQSNQQD